MGLKMKLMNADSVGRRNTAPYTPGMAANYCHSLTGMECVALCVCVCLHQHVWAYLSASISHFPALRVSSAWGPGADLSCRSAGQRRETDPLGQTAMATQPFCFLRPSFHCLSCVHSFLCLRTAVMCRDTKRGQLSSLITFHQLSLLLPWADRLMELSRLLTLSVKGNWCSSNIRRLLGNLNLSIFSVFIHFCRQTWPKFTWIVKNFHYTD